MQKIAWRQSLFGLCFILGRHRLFRGNARHGFIEQKLLQIIDGGVVDCRRYFVYQIVNGFRREICFGFLQIIKLLFQYDLDVSLE